jgi:hypothetical protein
MVSVSARKCTPSDVDFYFDNRLSSRFEPFGRAVTTEFLMDDAHMRDWYYWTIIANSRRALDTILGEVSQYSVGAT